MVQWWQRLPVQAQTEAVWTTCTKSDVTAWRSGLIQLISFSSGLISGHSLHREPRNQEREEWHVHARRDHHVVGVLISPSLSTAEIWYVHYERKSFNPWPQTLPGQAFIAALLDGSRLLRQTQMTSSTSRWLGRCWLQRVISHGWWLRSPHWGRIMLWLTVLIFNRRD